MFTKILGKSKEEASEDKVHQEIIQRVAKMQLTDMRIYVNNKLSDLEICENGLSEVMRRLNSIDEKTEKKFIDDDAMDTKKKKAFDIVIMVAASKKATIVVVELMQEFIELYNEMILEFDKQNKQIYKSKLQKAVNSTITTIGTKAAMNKKMNIIGT